MLKELFDIEKFNVFMDNDHYYFFRALNMSDNADIENQITVNSNGEILRIRTDLERYPNTPIYSSDSSISLKEVFDHIKEHHRIDTNCISLSSNANVAAIYGRGSYKDKYVMIKVPKKELGTKVYNAGLYMMEEIQKRIDTYLKNNPVDEMTKYYLSLIENTMTQEKLNEVVAMIKGKEPIKEDDFFEKGIEYQNTNILSMDYQALTTKQNFEKNKMVAKINVLKENMIPTVANNFLIRTLGIAFSSLELIHYKEIEKEEIIELSKEMIDVLALLQQVPESEPMIEKLKEEVIQKIIEKKDLKTEFPYIKEQFDTEQEYTIENMYLLTEGKVDFQSAISLYKKTFYFAKSKLRALHSMDLLTQMVEEKNYETLFAHMKNQVYGIEPEIFSKQSKNQMKISESVSLDFKPKERFLFESINQLSEYDLHNIMNHPKEALKDYLKNSQWALQRQLDKEEYYANAIIDLFDWEKLGITGFSSRQKEHLIKSLKEAHVVQIYDALKERNIKEKDIANVLLTTIIKDNSFESINLKDSFTIEELEDFLDYYKINQTKGLKLRSYQAVALKHIDEHFKEKPFTAVVLPTGAGKSFVALAEMLEHKEGEILYVAPNDEILNQIEKYILEYICYETTKKSDKEKIKEVFKRLKLCTYASLLSEKRNEVLNGVSQRVVHHPYDLIIFDELHRTGAAEWKKSILELLNHQTEDTKILGITATPTRDMDFLNMAEVWAKHYGYTEEEIQKHRHLSMNMDLEQAIQMGYVVNPKVVTCEYNLYKDGSLDKLKSEIEEIEDPILKKQELEKYEALRRNVLNADGIEKVIGDNVQVGGKYIVFCPMINKEGKVIETEDGIEADPRVSGKEIIEKYQKELILNMAKYRGIETDLKESDDMNQFIPVANQLGLEFHSLLGMYSKAKNKYELQQFEKEDPNKIKFITVINKLNEGSHAKADGNIWFRALDENSKTLYLQQLGRIIYATDPNKEVQNRPIAIDLVNNTLRVKMNKTKKDEISDLDKLKLASDWIEIHNGQIPDLNSSNKTEARHGLDLSKIQNTYSNYAEHIELLDSLSEKEKREIQEIIQIGSNMNLWGFDFPEIIPKETSKTSKKELDYDSFEVKGLLKDYCEIKKAVEDYNQSEFHIIQMVETIVEYCHKFQEWPKRENKENQINGKTSDQLANWLKTSGYNRNEFKYKDVTYEDGRYLKDVLDELYHKYGQEKQEQYGCITYVKAIEAYCKTFQEWPKQGNKEKQVNGKTSDQLARWLNYSGYTKNNFKYKDKQYEDGKYLNDVLDELHQLYYEESWDCFKWIETIVEYCQKFQEWPKQGNKEKQVNGKTSDQLAKWLNYSGYTKNNFKYKDKQYEDGKYLKDVLDFLHQQYYGEVWDCFKWVETVEAYCHKFQEWPKQHDKEKQVNGKTSDQLAQWLSNSGYNRNNFKYKDEQYEDGRYLKDVLDELHQQYYGEVWDCFKWVETVEAYCHKFQEWPKQHDKEKQVNGKTSVQLANWLKYSGYTKNDFKYKDVTYEDGRNLQDVLDFLHQQYYEESWDCFKWVETVAEYCHEFQKWPTFDTKEKQVNGKTSDQLAQWLSKSGYNRNNFKYKDVTYEDGRNLQDVLDELYQKYGRVKQKVVAQKSTIEELKSMKNELKQIQSVELNDVKQL